MQLPPLNALRAFEVASRHQHFKQAAAELGVTPGAVGRQIKLLEAHLGVTLFERDQAAVRLTRTAGHYARIIHEALSIVERATVDLSRRGRRKPLRVWCSRTFMRQWLMPRLAAYHAAHPKEELIFSTSDGLRDVDGRSVDVAIRLGDGRWSDLKTHHLFDNHLVPVCSPAYLAEHGPIAMPEELSRHVLLQSLRRNDDWNLWLAAAGHNAQTIRNTLGFEGDSLAYQAAQEGIGIALARKGFFEHDVAAGRIVPLFDIEAKAPGSFYLVYDETHPISPRARAFCSWVLAEVTKMAEPPPAPRPAARSGRAKRSRQTAKVT